MPSLSAISEQQIQRFLSAPIDYSGVKSMQRADDIAAMAGTAAKEVLSKLNELAPRVARAAGFSAVEARRAIQRALEPVMGPDFAETYQYHVDAFSDYTSNADWPSRAVVIGGGCTPQPNVQAVVTAVMISDVVLFRPSSLDTIVTPSFVRAFGRILEMETDYRDTPLLLMANWKREDVETTRRVLGAADSLTAFGDQETLDRLASFLRPEARRFFYGPKISFAAIDLSEGFSEEALKAAIDALADDIAAYDQRGCLSPMALYLIGGAETHEGVLNMLASALRARGAEHGYTPSLPAGVAAAIQSLRGVYAMDPEGSRRVYASESLPGWTLLYDEADKSLRSTPGYQTMFVHPVRDWAELVEAVRPMSGKLQAIGLEPSEECMPVEIYQELRAMGLSDIAEFGGMQDPGVEWIHDGNPIFPIRMRAYELDPEYCMGPVLRNSV